MLVKLNYWIFTATTDTIAWNILLPRDTFQKLFGQDWLVASLLELSPC
jgi:regulator-associated protein of mTOR